MNLTGKSAEEIRAMVADVPQARLVGMLIEMATLEQWWRPSEIARRRRMNVREVRTAMKAGKLGGGYYRRHDAVMLASTSGVAAWDSSFFVRANDDISGG